MGVEICAVVNHKLISIGVKLEWGGGLMNGKWVFFVNFQTIKAP